jgi:hypothetical protein
LAACCASVASGATTMPPVSIAMTFGRLATVLLLVGIVAVSATGCVLVPYPVGGYGHYDHHGR